MSEFSLDINEIQEDVEKTLEEEKEKLPTEKIESRADENAVAIFETDFDDIQKRESIINSIENFGIDEINRSSKRSNALLNTRLKDITAESTETEKVGTEIEKLRIQLEEIDPSQVKWVKQDGIIGKLFNPIKKYFDKYETAEEVIAAIIESLDQSNKVLNDDNVTLLAEEKNLTEDTKQLITDVELAKKMDSSIELQIEEAEINGENPEKIKIVREEILFPLRQRVMDLQQMIVVNQQAIVSLNVVRKNNIELIRAIRRAKTVSVTALRTGVMVASSLYNQRIAIDKINALNTTTESIIDTTSKLLRQQGTEIQTTSSEAMISPEVLKESFNEALQALNDISTYKQEALPQMKETINSFSEFALEGQKAIDKMEYGEVNKLP